MLFFSSKNYPKMSVDKLVFVCPVCGDSPRVLFGDSTSVTIQSGFYDGIPINLVSAEGVQSGQPHKRVNRMFICTKAAVSESSRRRCQKISRNNRSEICLQWSNSIPQVLGVGLPTLYHGTRI